MTTHPNKTINQYMIRQNVEALAKWIEGFLRDCRVKDLSPFTIEYYRAQLAAFEIFAQARDVIQVPEITPDLLRAYLLELEATRHNPGGRHAKYRDKTTHSLRHTAITAAIRNHAPAEKVRGMSRHASLDTLMIYYHETDRIDDPTEQYISYE